MYGAINVYLSLFENNVYGDATTRMKIKRAASSNALSIDRVVAKENVEPIQQKPSCLLYMLNDEN